MLEIVGKHWRKAKKEQLPLHHIIPALHGQEFTYLHKVQRGSKHVTYFFWLLKKK